MAKKRKISSAVRERLRKMREKFGLGEYKNKSSPKRIKKTRSLTGVKRMAKRRRSFGRRSSGLGAGLGGISIKGILVGAGGAEIADNMGVTGIIPYGNYVAGAGAGKLAKTGVLSGLIGAVARDMLKGNLLGSKGSNFGGAY